MTGGLHQLHAARALAEVVGNDDLSATSHCHRRTMIRSRHYASGPDVFPTPAGVGATTGSSVCTDFLLWERDLRFSHRY